MADYVQMSDLAAELPGKFLIQALDDNKDGVADPEVFAAIQKAVKDEIDGKVGQQIDPAQFGANPPALVKSIALVLASEKLYRRRGIDDKNNPYSKRAKDERAKLDAISTGDQVLTPKAKKTNASGAALVADAKTVSKSGRTS